jgi:hypothetical protein
VTTTASGIGLSWFRTSRVDHSFPPAAARRRHPCAAAIDPLADKQQDPAFAGRGNSAHGILSFADTAGAKGPGKMRIDVGTRRDQPI